MNVKELRGIDKYILTVASMVLVLYGLYFAGPWYIAEPLAHGGGVIAIMNNVNLVHFMGLLYMTTGAGIIYTIVRGTAKLEWLLRLLFAAVVVRTFALAGSLAARDDFLPPTYILNIAIILICVGYWLYIKSLIRDRVD